MSLNSKSEIFNENRFGTNKKLLSSEVVQVQRVEEVQVEPVQVPRGKAIPVQQAGIQVLLRVLVSAWLSSLFSRCLLCRMRILQFFCQCRSDLGTYVKDTCFK